MGEKAVVFLICLVLCFLRVQNLPLICSHCDCSNINATYTEVICQTDIKQYNTLLFENSTESNKTSNNDDVNSISDLSIKFNDLTVLSNVFRVDNVIRLDLRNNMISELADSVFNRLQKMETLILSQNNIEVLKPDVFKGQYMAGDLYPLKSLRTLILDQNKLHSLNADLFEHVEKIEYLSLARNPLEVIDTHTAIAITNLMNLKFLDLSYTQLSSIPKYFLHTPKYLKVLKLSGNSFTEVPRELAEAHSLETFEFNDNAIEELTNKNGFPKLPTIRVLHLCQMDSLTSIGPGSLANLTNLQELYVAGNPKLTRIDDAALSTPDAVGTMNTWPDIKKFYLNDNQISYINKSLLAHWESLVELDLLDNPWTCECENQWIVETLMPLYLKIDEEKAKAMKCAAPIEMIAYTFEELHERNYNMRCLDYYGAQPDRDAALIVGMLAGLLLGIPLVLFCIYSYKRQWFGYFDDSPASFSRRFYKRADDIYEY